MEIFDFDDIQCEEYYDERIDEYQAEYHKFLDQESTE
tara:strand:- start:569 stop:679 length:111 start_codon:yes stop_codon:yes gene_type:complete